MQRFITRAVALIFAALVISAAVPAMASSPAPAANSANITLDDLHSKGSVTVAPGTEVQVIFRAQTMAGYQWHVTWVDADCSDDQRYRQGNFKCFDRSLTPVPGATSGEFTSKITAPSVPAKIKVTYAYFPPMVAGQQSNTAVLVFEATVVVK